MKKIINWITRWQLYLVTVAAVIMSTLLISAISPNGLILVPIAIVIIAIAIETIRGIIHMFKHMDDE